MLIGIDDTDSPEGMCTTYLGAVLSRRLIRRHMQVKRALLVRLNPNVTYKTRGNAAIALEVDGDPDIAFAIASATIGELADFTCANTNPGLVLVTRPLDPGFYRKAVTDFCTIEEAEALLNSAGARYRGYKNRRGLIGATAAVACDLADRTYEILTYRQQERWGTPRSVERESLFAAQEATFPHTWDSVDEVNDVVVCVPHTPDPVLFGIRGESPSWVMAARQMIVSEETALEQIWVTNQGTDAHVLSGKTGELKDGLSYRVHGTVSKPPRTGMGGHVSFEISDRDRQVRCMAYEPTKNFRQVVRQLLAGDGIAAIGSYKKGSINLEKLNVLSLASHTTTRPPLCTACGKRMTSDGKNKGYKCRACGARSDKPEVRETARALKPGWYEVPPTARRHLARPLCRGRPDTGE
jgi:tRNA(Ile2)-agmatinylcytidine synthase